MISKLTHVCVYVLDQDSAYDFYVNKLGFKVHTDAPMGPGNRWLTVTPPEQPELEITLFLVIEGGIFTKETVKTMTELVKNGTFGAAVFTCHDLLATYEELKAKGVVFKKAPTKEFYGYEALFVDDSGNFFSLSQPA
ncbi:MAG: glyoxalase [Azospira oryzae]|jgi:catechol 2,3-dioxygenase-like lactoylglutathione lyase family enzyme|nr:MAG: glyoxalase [Azospira oryzae]